MAVAHQPGNESILLHIKSLISWAHATPLPLRTESQKVLLTEWRRKPSLPPPPFLAREQDPDTVYVDASGSGIGFTFNNQWQSWLLSKHWRQDGRNIQWAEAVAVELGIRLMIDSGLAATKIVLKSDNLNVVNAIKGKAVIREKNTKKIVNGIWELLNDYGMRLNINWVQGCLNPADEPSRLRCSGFGSGTGETGRFPYDCGIPEHLKEFVIPYVP
ncbi:hypothetical protein NP233_g12097 [Leucocoprinus birnbaumii]|uniref:RNase H type-1 domain-containing protein n=1 Tax=Leucocoprinus birnbaumii TaxID=56174 RepID=A0AAD5YQB5_9AGAR|nr:hypothetical protein NP233_g12097 [Leucocoprinus birnbaumii]